MTLRPALRPGAALLRRDAGHLQVGTSPGIIFPDRPGLLTFLKWCDGVRTIDRLRALAHESCGNRFPVDAVVKDLTRQGVIVDASTWSGRDAFAHEIRHRLVRGEYPTTAEPKFRLGIHHDFHTAEFSDRVRHILTQTGAVEVVDEAPRLLLIISCGEPSRTVFERATALNVAHLSVILNVDRVFLGPYVLPHLSPCLNCQDLYHSEADPGWPALVEQFGRLRTLTPPAIGTITGFAAATALAAEILNIGEGRDAGLSGRRITIGPRPQDSSEETLMFHPGCPCGLLTTA